MNSSAFDLYLIVLIVWSLTLFLLSIWGLRVLDGDTERNKENGNKTTYIFMRMMLNTSAFMGTLAFSYYMCRKLCPLIPGDKAIEWPIQLCGGLSALLMFIATIFIYTSIKDDTYGLVLIIMGVLFTTVLVGTHFYSLYKALTKTSAEQAAEQLRELEEQRILVEKMARQKQLEEQQLSKIEAEKARLAKQKADEAVRAKEAEIKRKTEEAARKMKEQEQEKKLQELENAPIPVPSQAEILKQQQQDEKYTRDVAMVDALREKAEEAESPSSAMKTEDKIKVWSDYAVAELAFLKKYDPSNTQIQKLEADLRKFYGPENLNFDNISLDDMSYMSDSSGSDIDVRKYQQLRKGGYR
jgi:hypothetical protein